MRIENPFHDGEIRAQKLAGESEEAQRNGKMLADSIMPGAIKFIAAQRMAAFGSLDSQANIWASLLFGPQGFASAPSEQQVAFDLSQCMINEGDPLWNNLTGSPRIGALFLELSTRRRMRINGSVTRIKRDQLTLDVQECFPNCPKYIQRRELRVETADRTSTTSPDVEGATLNHAQAELVRSADTFYVASAHAERGVDVSHRGGPPGFVEILDEQTLRIPDYLGNSMFNTLGNLTVDPRAGLVFMDFDRNRTLQITGRAEILWDDEDTPGASGGTNRFWEFHIDKVRESASHPGLRWTFVDYSPHNP